MLVTIEKPAMISFLGLNVGRQKQRLGGGTSCQRPSDSGLGSYRQVVPGLDDNLTARTKSSADVSPHFSPRGAGSSGGETVRFQIPWWVGPLTGVRGSARRWLPVAEDLGRRIEVSG